MKKTIFNNKKEMSLTKKELVQFIQQKKHVHITALYKHFDISSTGFKQKVKKMLKDLQSKETIWIDEEQYKISWGQKPLLKDNKKHDSKDRRGKSKPSSDVIFRYTEDSLEDLKIIKQKHSIPGDFIPAISKELEDKVWNDKHSIEHHRKDFRDLFTITIDGEDSKDLDDAVTISRTLFGGWELGVHIADVSYYVPQDTALDVEAQARANSYYFINKVTPMLPKELSNELCSLNPNEEKKSMSIFIRFNGQGNIKSYKIVPSVIKTNYRMTYTRVEEIMQGAEEKDTALKNTVLQMKTLFQILHKKRMKNGSIDFNFREKKIALDDKDFPVKIYQKDRLDSERLIEEFMLAANQAAGEFLTKNGMGLYRVHDIPPSEKYQRLRNFASKRGYTLSTVPNSKELQEFVNSLIGLPVQMCGEILTLRSMAQAVYQQENIGHFGLGFELYAHFTSPIRRYADLVVHRLIKYYLYKSEFKAPPYTSDQLDKIAQYISAQERIALEAERDLYKIKSVRMMKSLEGETRKGKISSIASFGLFLEDNETGIEAMLRFSDMKEYMIFNEDELAAHNRNKSIIYNIGMEVEFKISRVNVERAFIDANELKVL